MDSLNVKVKYLYYGNINMNDLLNDLISRIGIFVPIKNISDLCQTNVKFNSLFCNNYFWEQKFIHDFGEISRKEKANFILWKESYINHGKVVVFGSNGSGQLGLNNTQDYNIITQIFTGPELSRIRAKIVSCGDVHTIIVDINNNVWSFGDNNFGQLGLGDIQRRFIPTQILETKAKAVSCGANFTIIIDMNDEIWGIGANLVGQSGLGNLEFSSIPHKIMDIKIKSISCGAFHTMVVDLNNNIWTFGKNEDGQLGLGSYNIQFVPIQIPNIKAKMVSCGDSHTMFIDMDDNVWAFGNNEYGQLGVDDTQTRSNPIQLSWNHENKAKFISCGYAYTMIIDMNDNIWAFGDNEFGQLGLGDEQTRHNPALIPGIKAEAISCGDNHTIIIDMNNELWVFGYNRFGQLGLGDIQDRFISIPTDSKLIKAKNVFCGSNHTIIILF